MEQTKKDGTLRFCLDFRKVNAASKLDLYPMLRIDDLVERIGPSRFNSTPDMCKGYWQVPLTPVSREITVLRTPFGHFQFTVLPFGLSGAPVMFQWMMDKVLAGMESCAAAYLDDVVIFSNSWEEHLCHLKTVNKIAEAGLTICPEQCSLAKQRYPVFGLFTGERDHLITGGEGGGLPVGREAYYQVTGEVLHVPGWLV